MLGAIHIPKHYCHTHRNEMNTLNLVCQDEACADSVLLCRKCANQFHAGHSISEVEEFVQNVQAAGYKYQGSSIVPKSQATVKQAKATTLGHYSEMKHKMIEKIDEVGAHIKTYFDNREGQCVAMAQNLPVFANRCSIEEQDQLSTVNNKIAGMKTWMSTFSTASSLVDTSNEQISYKATQTAKKMQVSLTDLTNAFLAYCDLFLKEFRQVTAKPTSLSSARSTTRSSELQGAKKRDSSNSEQQPSEANPVIWEQTLSPLLHHDDIIPNGNTAVRFVQSSHCSVGILGSLSTGNTPLQSIGCRLKIDEMTSQLEVGIASERMASGQFYYQQNWRKCGHGHYLVSTTGSSCASNSTQVSTSLKMGKGDVVELVLNPKEKVLKVSCKGKTIEIGVAEPSPEDCYRFVVYLRNKRDRVTLLDGSNP